MLVNFWCENFKPFYKTQFSMEANSTQKQLNFSILKTKIDKTEYKTLCSSVICGMNFSGKSNFIDAMNILKKIILNGKTNILKENMRISKNDPFVFGIQFIHKNKFIEYQLKINSEKFSIIEEKLHINNISIFYRAENNIVLDCTNEFQQIETWKIEGATKNNELFLTNNFKKFFENEMIETILEWFNNSFIIVTNSTKIDSTNFSQKVKNLSNELMKKIDFENNFETTKTKEIKNKISLIAKALLEGSTLVIDDFDIFIHPMIVMDIIINFHNDDTNKNKAQLIFTTENPIYLDNGLFRENEIYFIEKNQNGYSSDLYSLSQFRKTPGSDNTEYMENYFKSLYGAIKYVDFASVLEKEMENQFNKEKMNVSQWGSQWNDPIDWTKLNYSVSKNGRKFIRHPSGMGTVMSMNDGVDRNILVLDAQYRGRGFWTPGSYSREHYCTNYGNADGSQKSLPFSGWTDSTLNSSYSENANQDIYTSKENTDYMMSKNPSTEYLAGFCRSKLISYNGIKIGCDAPNINTLIRIYAEMIQLDSMDPTITNYSGYSLSGWFSGAFGPICWSSSLYDSSRAMLMYCFSDIGYDDFVNYYLGFAPILEV